MKLSRNEIFDLMKKEVSDELLLAIKKEKDILFREMTKHRNIAYSIGEHVQTYNRILNKHEKRLTKLLTNGEGW